MRNALDNRKPLKPKKCKSCKEEFQPFNSLAQTCSIGCAVSLVAARRERLEARKRKALRKDTRERKKALKTRSDHLRDTQRVINKYVRMRDSGKPCISCDKPDNGQHQRHASHFKSVGSNSALRFNLWNIHASCSTCNAMLSGNLLEYKPRLIEKIGIDRVSWIESQNQSVKYEIDYLERLKKVFSKRVRVMEKRYNCI